MNAKTFFSDRPIAYHPILAKVIGSVTAALFLSQIAYWSDKGFDKDGWIYKTESEMEEETGLSRKEQETARKALVWSGILKEERRGIPARMWYLLDWDALTVLLDEYERTKKENPPDKSPKTRKQVVQNVQTGCAEQTYSTEITTETTSKRESTESPAPNELPEEAKPLWRKFQSSLEKAGDLYANRFYQSFLAQWIARPDIKAFDYAFSRLPEHNDGFRFLRDVRSFNPNPKPRYGNGRSAPPPKEKWVPPTEEEKAAFWRERNALIASRQGTT